MKTIGLIGGLTWESTALYYKILNSEIHKRLGGKHSAKIRMYSFDFDEIDKFNVSRDFEGFSDRLIEEAVKLEQAGAEVILLCANTPHMWFDEVQEKVGVPMIHIADATGNSIVKKGFNKVLLLGTRLTMEKSFVSGKLEKDYGIHVVVPEIGDRKVIQDIIYDELAIGLFKDTTRKILLKIIAKYADVQGVILGCTELPLIIKPVDTKVPLFNTTEIHAMAAVDFALK